MTRLRCTKLPDLNIGPVFYNNNRYRVGTCTLLTIESDLNNKSRILKQNTYIETKHNNQGVTTWKIL